MSGYKIVEFFCHGVLKRVVCDGPEGPSALTAIFNCMSLSFPDQSDAPQPDEDQYLKAEELKQHLLQTLASQVAELLYAGYNPADELNRDHQQLIGVIDSLSSNPEFDLAPCPGSVVSFGLSDLRSLITYLGLYVVHGWLLDPEFESVLGDSYSFMIKIPYANLVSLVAQGEPDDDDSARKVKLVEDFLAAAKNPCTSYGYQCLNYLNDGIFALFYWNNKLNVIHKNDTYLLILETDRGVLDRFPDVTWRVFEEAEGESIYLTSQYSVVLNQPNLAKALEWFKNKGFSNKEHSNEPSDGQGAEAVLSPKTKRNREKKKKRTAKKLAEEEELLRAQAEKDQLEKEQAEKDETEKDRLEKEQAEKDRPKKEQAEKDEAEKDRLEKEQAEKDEAEKDRLEKEQVEKDRLEKQQAEKDWLEKEQAEQAETKQLEKEQAELDEKDCLQEAEKEMSSAICDDFKQFLNVFQDDSSSAIPYFRGVVESLKYTQSRNFYVPYDFIKSHDKSLALRIQDNYPRISEDLNHCAHQYLLAHSVHTAANLNILNLPSPKSVQAFADFADSIALLEECIVYLWGVEESPSYLGRKMALGYLHLIVEKFREGRCFGGRWNIPDMWVTDGGANFTIECEDEGLTDSGGLLDLERFDETVLSRFFTKKGSFPPYFEELRKDFKLLPGCRKDPKKWDRYLSLISYPFALKAPLVRSAFICNVYRAADSVCSKHSVYAPLHVKMDSWKNKATGHPLIKEVYDYQNFGNGPWTQTYTLTKWADNCWDLLKFCRHCIEHMLRYSKNDQMVQQIQDIKIIDMTLALQLGEFISHLVRYIVLNGDLDELFSSAWAHFMGSDCFDKPRRSIAMGTTELEDLVSSFSDFKSCGHEIGWAETEVRASSSAAGSSKRIQKSVVIGYVNLDEFMELLKQHQLLVSREGDGDLAYLLCGSIRVYKDWRKKAVGDKFVLDYNSDPVIIVAGPVCDDYYQIFTLLCLWLGM